MNKTQRKNLAEAVSLLSNLTDRPDDDQLTPDDVKKVINDAESIVTSTAEEEREKFDNLSEGLQAGPTGQGLEEAADNLESVTFPDVDDFDLDTTEGREGLAEAIQAAIDEIEAV